MTIGSNILRAIHYDREVFVLSDENGRVVGEYASRADAEAASTARATLSRVQQTPDDHGDGADLSPLRAQILACFLAPEPTSSFDLRDRAIMVRSVAEFIVSLEGARNALARALMENTVRQECAKMKADGLLLEPAPNIMDHHKPPPDTYILTPGGESLAWAVLEKVKEAAR